jgi:predicted AAA+ superfamily ATPase
MSRPARVMESVDMMASKAIAPRGVRVRVPPRASPSRSTAEAVVRHLRTQTANREVDLIVARADERIVAFEVKLARTVDDADVGHLVWLQDKLGDDLLDAAVITSGTDAYRRRDGIAVIPAALLGP